jgi:hypothetical protein
MNMNVLFSKKTYIIIIYSILDLYFLLMARAATTFDNDADDDIPDRHYGKPYDRELYNQLAATMKLKQAEMDEDAAYWHRQRTSPPPPSERYKDLRKYLYEHQPEANTDTALVACSHTTRPGQCMRARASMMVANPTFPLTARQRLGALGRTPSLVSMSHRYPSFTSFLVKQLSKNPTDSWSDGKHAIAMQGRSKKKSPLLLENGKKNGGKSRTHKSHRGQKSRKSRRGQKSRKSRRGQKSRKN